MNRAVQTVFLVLLTSSLLFTSCRKEEDKPIHVCKEELSVEEMNTIGDAIKDKIVNNSDEYIALSSTEYPDAYKYVNDLMRMLINTEYVNHRNDFDWDVTILHDDEMSTAFISPGGHLFIYTGLLKFLRSESQLLSLMAHEISYADKEYIVEALISEYDCHDLGDILLENRTNAITEIATGMKTLSYDKSRVEEADNYSIQTLCPFQYDASGIKNILIDAAESGEQLEWLLTRPSYTNRINSIGNLAASCGEEEEVFEERYVNFKYHLLP